MWSLKQLLYEKTKVRERDTSVTELKTMTSKHHVNKKGPKCYHCRRNGTAVYLMKKQKRIPGRIIQKRKHSSLGKCKRIQNSSEANSVIGLLTHHALLTNIGKSSWIVDSGTCHMCHHVRKFTNFKKLDIAEKITLGDGFSVEALGTGTIQLSISVLDGKYQRCRLYEILYAPKLPIT